MKLALVHDYLTQMGGAEKVLQNFQGVYRDSPVFVLVNDCEKTKDIFSRELVRSSWLQRLPGSAKKYQWYLMLMPGAIESHKFQGYDVILSSTSSFAKGVKVPKGSLHICYCHTPTRYLWHDAGSYVQELNYNKLVKSIVPLFLKRLRHWDLIAAGRVDRFIANSRVVADRIKKYYNRDSVIIYPPVETEKFFVSNQPGDYYLIGGRLVAYKKYDLAVRAFNKLGIKLKVFGTGPEMDRLQKMARKNIEFLGNVSDNKKAELYSKAIAFLHPQVEDFGITAIEAMASGRPVIAYFEGGARETVVPGQTGEFLEEQIWECLVDKIIHFHPEKYDAELIRAHAERFNQERFQRQIRDYVEREWEEFRLKRVFRMK